METGKMTAINTSFKVQKGIAPPVNYYIGKLRREIGPDAEEGVFVAYGKEQVLKLKWDSINDNFNVLDEYDVDNVEDMAFDHNLGLVYIRQSQWPKVCKIKNGQKEAQSFTSCFMIEGNGLGNINTLTPLHGYNSVTYPYLLLRSDYLHIIDVKTFEVL